MPKLTRGVVIAVEGIDGSGKSTLAKNLAATLTTLAYPVLLTKEPGGTSLGKQLRTIVQEYTEPIDFKAEFLLYAADRAQHWHELILPNKAQHKLIISDRMSDSSLVYQGYGRSLSIEHIRFINNWVMDNQKPDLTIYVKVDVETALTRFKARNEKLTRFEQEKKEFFERLKNGFDTLYREQTDVITIDGHQTIETITDHATAQVITWMKQHTLLI
jgi:dTMP kinase